MKPLTRMTTAVLSSLLVLLGFGSCRSAKKAVKEEAQSAADSLRRTIDTPEPVLRDPDMQMRVLYGPPPGRYIQNIDQDE